MDVAICIVNHNTRDLLLECLDSIKRHADAAEVVVVDAASTDGSAAAVRERHPDVRVIELERNLGFGAGCNRGIEATKGEAVLLLNADTRLTGSALGAMTEALAAEETVALVGPRLVGPDATLQRSCRTFPTLLTAFFAYTGLSKAFPRSRLFGRYEMGWWDYDERREVDWLSGACMLVRRSSLAEVGLFDEDYYMYAEEADLCMRLRRAGRRVVYEPAAEVVHHEGASTSQRWPEMVMASHRSTLRFFRKHYGRASALALRAIVFGGNLVRLLGASVVWLVRPSARPALGERLGIYAGALRVSLSRCA
ncbi:MAG: glycosyltransferase family 2 protein [Armatimonadota bacterium]